MRLGSTVKNLRARCDLIWAKPRTRQIFVIVATCLAVTVQFYPIIKKVISPQSQLTKEQIDLYYDKDNYYPIQVRKQREQEKLSAQAEE